MIGRWLGSGLALVAVTAGVSGCGAQPEFATNDVPPDAGPPPPPPTVTAPAQDAGAPPPAPTAANCDGVQSLAMTTMFQGRATAEAPKMQPEGAPICGVAPEGLTVSGTTFMLQPGSCYTFLAQALPTVTEVDIQLELDLGGGGQLPPALAAFNLKPVLAVDSDSGPTAAIGAKQSCYQWPFPIPAAVKLVVKARTGSGPIAAQAYSRKK